MSLNVCLNIESQHCVCCPWMSPETMVACAFPAPEESHRAVTFRCSMASPVSGMLAKRSSRLRSAPEGLMPPCAADG